MQISSTMKKKKNFGHNAIRENEVVWELKIEGEREKSTSLPVALRAVHPLKCPISVLLHSISLSFCPMNDWKSLISSFLVYYRCSTFLIMLWSLLIYLFNFIFNRSIDSNHAIDYTCRISDYPFLRCGAPAMFIAMTADGAQGEKNSSLCTNKTSRYSFTWFDNSTCLISFPLSLCITFTLPYSKWWELVNLGDRTSWAIRECLTLHLI